MEPTSPEHHNTQAKRHHQTLRYRVQLRSAPYRPVERSVSEGHGCLGRNIEPDIHLVREAPCADSIVTTTHMRQEQQALWAC